MFEILALIVFIISFIIIVLMFLFAIDFVFTILYFFRKPHAPFVPVPQKSLIKIIENIDIKKANKVFDLGSGDGRVLKILAQKYPDSSFVGIEKSFSPYFISKWLCRKNKNISLENADFFKKNLSEADVLILYLFPEVLNALLPKFEKELKKDTVVYSIDFEFKDKKPEKVLYFENDKERGNKLLVYRF